ncbi:MULTISPECIES: hypothetical protein [Clostridium]|uniref:Uncharacterized protein n=1 Tax=Clostridium botulinum TaxID=1491 RepID=A0A6B4JLZ3_CLOBO|nr:MULTISPECIES: hypothetical protein [Clostridium]EES48950.1 hypothetical protein CLO_2123 [Clostridium botulinum E1 str. 'BoNT E Beluga']MBN1043750.1 hypothetical protein [Clostridium botulinum]MBY6761162.1 hypothetical protein [Clostridium botulinum]MBY6837982.1 hypothetical protein [Clostridium botulinum]MBY6921360.1 hypothetical protein [Clostridium botulinum]
MGYEVDELKDLPEEWITLLNSMPKVKNEFIDYKRANRDEMIPPYFFSYFSEDYMLCKPYFLCFERGEEVFNNFYNLFGKNEPTSKEIDDIILKKLFIKRIEGINDLYKLSNERLYNIQNMKFEKTTYDELSEEYNLHDIEEIDIKDYCSEIMWTKVLPDEKQNPICAFEEALYNLTLEYNIVYYILWPLGKKDNIENPYSPYVELWKKGIKTYVIDENLVKYIL